MASLITLCPIIDITNADTDQTIMRKVGESIGHTIEGLDWHGVSGQGAVGVLEVKAKNGGAPTKYTFRARPIPEAGGGMFLIGRKWVIPYRDNVNIGEILLYRAAEDRIRRLH